MAVLRVHLGWSAVSSTGVPPLQLSKGAGRLEVLSSGAKEKRWNKEQAREKDGEREIRERCLYPIEMSSPFLLLVFTPLSLANNYTLAF